MVMTTLGWVSVVFLITANPPAAGDQTTPVAYKLQDFRGAWHELGDVRDRKLVVLAFVGTECPMAALYAPRLAELARAYAKKGVVFFGVDSNAQDALSALARFAKEQNLPFPILKDVGNELADRLGVARTPEVVVLDSERRVAYRGRIDDQYGFGVHRPAPLHRDLTNALDDLLADRAVRVPRTEAAGCRIGRVPIKKEPARGSVTYSKEVSRILRDRCVACHREGEIAPFTLTSYAQAAGWAAMIQEVIESGRMPPWHASPAHGTFANEARLTQAEKQTVAAWIAAGLPEGDPHDLPEPPRFVKGWRIPAPDLVVQLPRTVSIPAEGTMPYENFVIDPKLTQDVWVQASQVRPGNPSVVHHLVVFVLPPGTRESDVRLDFLAAYAPGMPPRILPAGTAKLIPAGSRLMFQVHYTPRGTPQTDRSEIGFRFADPKTIHKQMTAVMALNTSLRIPPGADDHPVTAQYRFDQDTLIYSLLPHMHLRGKSFQFVAHYPDGRREVLLDVPRYEFDWQNVYVLSKPKLMPEGTLLRCLGRYDNSPSNPSNPDPKSTVRWGEQTRDEMLVGYVEVTLADQDLSLGEPSARKLADGRYEVTFHYPAPKGASAVYLAGTFNEWKPTAHKMDGPNASGVYETKLTLDAGTYEYKFVLDGTRWRQDPGNRRQVGFYNNSLLEVGNARERRR
jgi:peroxiredoxin